MLSLNITFVVEMSFGNGYWAGNLRWDMVGGISVIYVAPIIITIVSSFIMLWLAATPLKSASSRSDAQTQMYNGDNQASGPESFTERDQNDYFNEIYYDVDDESLQKRELTLASEESHLNMSTSTPDLNLPEALLDSDSSLRLTTIEENLSDITYSSSTPGEIFPGSTVSKKYLDGEMMDAATLMTEPSDLVKTLSVEGDSQTEKNDEEDTCGPEESSKPVSGNSGSVTSERLVRSIKRQLTVILDEFWGKLFDYHGKSTQEAKTTKLDALLGVVDSKPACASPKIDSRKEFLNFSSPRQQMGPSYVESYYGTQKESSLLWSSNTQLLDTTYMQMLNRNATDPGERRYSILRDPSSVDFHDDQPATAHGYQITYMSRIAKEASSGSLTGPMDPGERRYSSLRIPPSVDFVDAQPATVHGYQMGHLSRIAKERRSGSLTGQMESIAPKSPSLASSDYRDPFAIASGQRPRRVLSAKTPPGFLSLPLSRNNSLQPERPFYGISSTGLAENLGTTVNTKKCNGLPDISGLPVPHRNSLLPDRGALWDNNPTICQPSTGHTMYEASLYLNALSKAYLSASSQAGAPSVFDEFSLLNNSRSTHSGSRWSRQPFEQFGVADKACPVEGGVGGTRSSITQGTASGVDFEPKFLQSFRICIQELLKLEGSNWLFRQSDGADEHLVERVAARERFLYEAKTREMNRVGHIGESHFSAVNEEMVTSVPHCGEGCIWRMDLIISFGVWCMHRVLELSLVESRPELWGKYTYVLNRLQGIIDLAFSRPRSPLRPCFCLEIPLVHQQNSSPPPITKQARGRCTTASMLLDMIKDIEHAISGRKGKSGTATGDVAYPIGKGNLASVLKRYKRRLSNKPVGTPHEGGKPGSYRVSLS